MSKKSGWQSAGTKAYNEKEKDARIREEGGGEGRKGGREKRGGERREEGGGGVRIPLHQGHLVQNRWLGRAAPCVRCVLV